MRRLALLLAAFALVVGHAEAAEKPNIIFILADDLGYGDLGCFGQKLIQTPHIDRLASEGTRFTNAYAGATVCAPSRCSLMTGLHNGHAPVRGPDALLEAHDQAPEHHREDGEAREAEEDRLEANLH